MVEHPSRTTFSVAVSVALAVCWMGARGSLLVAQEPQPSPVRVACSVDLSGPGVMRDILSNALVRGLGQPEAAVREFLNAAVGTCATGQDLLRATARQFKVDEAVMTAEVERFRHCNCAHGPSVGGRPSVAIDGVEPAVVSSFARNVILHVVLHELGHALIREFDLPVLGSEETMADAFATHYLTAHLPDRAVEVLESRTVSLMIEAREVPREEWTVVGEHESDARRAFQIAAIAVAADPLKYDSVAKGVGLTQRDIQQARDYGAEIHRSWRRVLSPLWMPGGMRSNEARVVCDATSELFEQIRSAGLVAELESIVKRFDWHSRVTIQFAAGKGGAGWSRSKRTITVHAEYIERFIAQGKRASSRPGRSSARD